MLSVYNGATDTEGVHVSMETVIQRILTGEKGLAEKTSHLNHLYQHDSDAYNREKVDLLAVTWSGMFPTGQRKAELLIKHSGYIVLDIDNDIDLDLVRSDLTAHPNVAFSFISPSGTGIKPIVPVEPVPKNVAEHKAAFDAVLSVFSEYAEQDPTKLPAQRDPNRLCFLAHDPTAVDRRDTASPVAWTMPLELSEQPDEQSDEKSDLKPPTEAQGRSTLKHLDAAAYPRWLEVGMACKAAGLPMSVWEDWSKSASNYKTGACQAKWDTFNGSSKSWGSVMRWSKKAQGLDSPTDSPAESPYFNKSHFIPVALMDALDEDFDFLALPTEKYLRVYKNGVYSLDNDGRLKREIHERLGSRLQARHVTETLELLRQRHMLPLPVDGQTPCCHPDVVNLQNCLYNVRDGGKTPHSPAFKSIVQLPVTYDAKAECPAIDAFLADVFRDEKEGLSDMEDITLAHEIIGYSMLMQLPFAKLFVLLGPTHTGKSTFLDVLTAFLGAENTSAVSLQALDDDTQRFARSGLYGKLANIAADLSKRSLAGDSKLKMIAAGDRFDVERKGVDSFVMRPHATLICAANVMPKSRDRSDAWLDRITILPFVNQHKGDDAKRNYIRELTTPSELSGLFNHAFVAVSSLLRSGKFTEGASVKEAGENYGLYNDQLLRFLTENYVRQQDTDFKDSHPERLPESGVYKLYKDWCADEGILHPTTKVNLRDAVEKWTGEKRVRVRGEGERSNANRPFVFQRLLSVGSAPPAEDDETSGVVPSSDDDVIPF